MRKMTFILLLFGLIFSLISCGATPKKKSNEELATIAFGLAVGKLDTLFEDKTNIEKNISLPLNFTDIWGLEIIWTSSERSIISDSGIFTRPNADIDITLKATMIYGTLVYTKEYIVTAKALDDDDDDDIEIPIVDYQDVFSIISEFASISDQVDENGNYLSEYFYGVEGIVIAQNGMNQILMYSEGAMIQIEGLHGVFTINIGDAYQISGKLMYQQYVPKIKVVNKLSTATILETHSYEEPVYEEVSLDFLKESNAQSILLHVAAITIEGYLNQGRITDSDALITIDLSFDYDEDFEGRYVEIQSIVYFDSLSKEWIFVEDSMQIVETMAPCPLC
ncbi:immunoglobulin-like domain-containing protein [Peloplasma aerotolerans]|uniref:Atrophied bacterial Ig domain-containing protein n=1 Tax=Peloplasma aerotolerans TaxID=3044389 RepID=A0AAW6U777_9MOLU|nr:immunoglobulin-like domain-containing protein [Mariniplasma sp. M4Ah]MDI6451931.1 hypothetical protein [Mariniplasma sp. M4Ah]